jgi:hypothetical protein
MSIPDINTLVLNDLTTLPKDEFDNAIENTLAILLEGQDVVARLLTCSYSDETLSERELANVGSIQSFISSLTITLLKVREGAMHRKLNELESNLEKL